MLGLAAIAMAATLAVQHGRLGFGLRCIQQNESAADMLGVNTTATKTSAFALSAVFTGIAGAIYASWVNYIEPPTCSMFSTRSSRSSWSCWAAQDRCSARS